MMARSGLWVAFLVLLVSPFVTDARGLRGHTSTSCDTVSKATLFLTSGSGYASATAYCEAEAKAKDAIFKLVTDWVHKVCDAPEHGCTAAELNIAVEGFAQATARAFTSVHAAAEVRGTGRACASGSAEGDAFAAAVLDVALEATLTVVHEKRGYAEKERVQKALNKASGAASGRAVSAAIASAWAAASEEVCTKGYKVEDSESSLGQQVRSIVAELLAEIAVTLCEEPIDKYDITGESATSESTSKISGEIRDDEFAVVEGNAGVDEGEIKPCEDLKGKICCRSYYQDKDTCRCGMRCQMETLVDYSPITNVKIWKDKKGDKCMCVY